MAITFFSSNRVETLQSRLARQLVLRPAADPFAAEIILVPTFAMARWLNLRIAQQYGIAANIQYPQMAAWIWTLAAQLPDDVPAYDPYSQQVLGWRIFSLLPDLLDQPEFNTLSHYLAADSNGIKRWQLSQRIAAGFDRYQIYRPETIKHWSAGREQHWQAVLWRKLSSSVKHVNRVDIIERLIDEINSPLGNLRLPKRLSLFAISSLAPLFIELLQALAPHCEISWFHHSPTDHYWADLITVKQQARKRLETPAHSDYFDGDNNLLASWGKQGQVLQDLLVNFDAISGPEVEDNHAPGTATLLQSLQGSLFDLHQPSAKLTVDDSISVHICHSPMRECQILQDQLLDLLNRHSDLNSEDILVMVPEIDRYAPYIEAVFQADTSHQRPVLAWNISDINVADHHPLSQTFLQLLKLPELRFTRSEILYFLECDEIRLQFGIDTTLLSEIREQIESTQVHWGIDASQRQQLGLPAIHENTWQQAWDRLFAGYALSDDKLWQNIAPLNRFDTDTGIALASLRHLFERLVYWRRLLATAANASTWQQRLHRLITEFFTPRSIADDRRQPLRDAIGELDQADTGALSPALIRHWMEQQLANSQQPGKLYTGGVTFCGMQPMRNIPFAVICVLGIQDHAFPRRDQRAEFDLMRHHWQPGDPSSADEDRYLMLETVLCARRQLYFSYTGRSLRDNSECQPSVLLRELLDYIDNRFITDPEANPMSQQITRVHAMQAFSARNFTPESPGYDSYWFDTATNLAPPKPAVISAAWPSRGLSAAPAAESVILLDNLHRFFAHPIRYFYGSRLGIFIPPETPDADEENFAIAGLSKWSLCQRMVDDLLHDRETDVGRLAAEGLLPHGNAAELQWRAVQAEYEPLLQRLHVFRGLTAENCRIEFELTDDILLHGNIASYYPGIGLMHFSTSKHIKARGMFGLWLEHLVLCACQKISRQESSELIATAAKATKFRYLEPALAQHLLTNYIALFRQGQTFPVPVFPNTSYAFAAHGDTEQALSKAARLWYGERFGDAQRGECDDEFVRLAQHNISFNPLTDPLFQRYAREIYGPLIEHGEARG